MYTRTGILGEKAGTSGRPYSYQATRGTNSGIAVPECPARSMEQRTESTLLSVMNEEWMIWSQS